MPQLNKGGKFVFGLSVIHENLSVQFPPQAVKEYQLLSEKLITDKNKISQVKKEPLNPYAAVYHAAQ